MRYLIENCKLFHINLEAINSFPHGIFQNQSALNAAS